MTEQNIFKEFEKRHSSLSREQLLFECYRLDNSNHILCLETYKIRDDNKKLKQQVKNLQDLQTFNFDEEQFRINSWYKKALRTCFYEAKKRAKKNKIDFCLSYQKLLMDFPNASCSLTGIPFNQTKTFKRNPFAPSIDRIDSNNGYTLENVRVVACCVNNAMNEWGEDVLRIISINYMNELIQKP
jgi:hypothetical protein